MAIVQVTSGRSTGSVDSFGLAYTNNLGAGRTLVVCAGSYTQQVLAASVTDTLGHTYTLDQHGGGSQRSAILSIPRGTSTAGANTVTINTAANSYFSLVLYEISELQPDWPVHASWSEAGISSTPQVGTFSATFNCLAIGHLAHESGGNPTITSVAPFVTDAENENTSLIAFNAQSRTYAANDPSFLSQWTIGASVSYAANCVVYKAEIVGQPFVRRFGGVPHAAGRISSRSW
jgi:hypothetical protein